MCRVAAATYPAYGPCDLSLIYSPLLLKLAVLGFVGAGGIGLIDAENMRLWNWDVVMFITLLLVAVVMIMDTLSAWLRRRYIGGAAVPLYQGGR